LAHQELGAARIAKNPDAVDRAVPNEMRVLWFSTRAEEAEWVVAKIRELLGTAYLESDGRTRGLTPADFAILMRSTRQPEPNGNPPRHAAFSNALAAAGIHYTLESGGGLFERPHVDAIRTTFELLRDGQPTRAQAQAHFDEQVLPSFPNANFVAIAAVLAEWGRLIHAPVVPGAPRRRIHPQQLLHDLLESFRVAETDLDNATLLDIGVFSQIMQDVEAVYPSIDSTDRFKSILNFLSVVADRGYDTTTDEVLARPDAVTVAGSQPSYEPRFSRFRYEMPSCRVPSIS
jgi:DNA helicase-2/ATP-dependent DNA helicase PcrA